MKDALTALTPPAPRLPAAPRENRPKAMATLESFAHHPDLARAFFTFNGHVLQGTTLTIRQRQILVLRVAARRQAAYLWAQHLFLAHDGGMTDEEIARVAFGPNAPFFEPPDAALIQAVDDLVDDGVIAEATWAALEVDLDVQQLLDVIFTVGCYETIAFFMRSLNLEVDPTIPELLRLDDGGA